MKYLAAIAVLWMVTLEAQANVCPDSSRCAGNQTCCATPDSKEYAYECCPYDNGVCCGNQKECCAAGRDCVSFLSFHICIKKSDDNTEELTTTTAAALHTERPKSLETPLDKITDIPCGSQTCPDNTTCCTAGCCPLPNAVCCSDNEHCCPAQTTCDVSAGMCISSNGQRTPVRPKLAHRKPEIVNCPDGTSFCPDFSTCCQLTTGQWGCCPYISAVCCNDRVHCCPQGTKCDPTFQYCLNGTLSTAASMKFQAYPLP